jgi:hypothetical protein
MAAGVTPDGAWDMSVDALDSDPTFAELMATYAELGDLLASGRADEGFESECVALVEQITVLGRSVAKEADKAWVVWLSRNTLPTVEGERVSERVERVDSEPMMRPLWPLAWVERCFHPGCDKTWTFFVPPAGVYRCGRHMDMEVPCGS